MARIYYEVETNLPDLGQRLRRPLRPRCRRPATNLVGTVGITAADCTQVRSAVAATEMATNPPNAPAPEAPAAACGANQVLQNRFFDDMENPGGDANWSTDDLSVWNFDDSYAHSGDFNLRGADVGVAATHSLELDRNVALPAGATSFLRFDHAYGFEDFSTTDFFDGGVLEFSTNGGATWADISGLPVDVGYNGTIDSATNPLFGRAAFVSESNGYRAHARQPELPGGPERALPLQHRHRQHRDADAAGSSTTSASTRACRTPTAMASRTTPTPARPWWGRRRLPAGHGWRRRHHPAAGWRQRRRRHQGDAQEREAAVLQDQRQGQEAAREVHAQQVRRRPPRDDHHQEGQEDGAQEVAEADLEGRALDQAEAQADEGELQGLHRHPRRGRQEADAEEDAQGALSRAPWPPR